MARLSLKTLFGRARDPAPAPAAEIVVNREAAEAELSAAQAAVKAAEAAYAGGLLSATDDALRTLDGARRDAAMRLDRAQALVAAFAEQLAQSNEVEKRAELSRIVEQAASAQATFQALCERELPSMAATARAILAQRDRAERTRTIAIRALEAAGEPSTLPPVEAFRAQPGRPREELSREVRDLWVDHAGNAIGRQEMIKAQSDGTATLSLPESNHLHRIDKKREFEIIEFLPKVYEREPAALTSSLSVPELYALAPTADRKVEKTMRPVGPTRDVGRRAPERGERRT